MPEVFKLQKKAFYAAYHRARDKVVAELGLVYIPFPFGGIAPLSVVDLSEISEPIASERSTYSVAPPQLGKRYRGSPCSLQLIRLC